MDEGDEPRTITARFATLGVVDLDGDIIERGAIGDQEVLLGAYNHDFQSLPPGFGATYETAKAAMFKGTFFDTPVGDLHYQTLKAAQEAGYNMEWSFRFFVEDGGFETRKGEEYYVIRKAKVSHVAPVEKGAGINTGTVEVKVCGPECQAAQASGGSSDGAQATGTAGIDYDELTKRLAEVIGPAITTAIVSAMGECDGCKGSKSQTDATTDATTKDDQGQDKGQSLGDLLRELRDEKELTNDDLADAAGLSVSGIGGILAGTTTCPKVTQLQGLSRRLGVNLSRLVSAAEQDGCDQYDDDDQSGADDPGADKTADADDPTDSGDAVAAGTDDTQDPESDESIAKQLDALLSGFPGIPDGVDSGLMAWDQYKEKVLEV